MRTKAKALWLTNCCHCGRVIDKREQSDGGDKFGAELADGRWACSFECYAAVVPDDAPTPSPDIAGLVDRLRLWAQWETRRKAPRPQTARPDDLYKAADTLQRVAQERDALILVGKEMLNAQTMSMAEIQAFSDAEALIDQITRGENIAEARIATARDEGLEMAAKVADGFFEGPGVAAAIRLLKGQPK